jgi:acetyl-CoA C-acetyltransferase
LNIKRAYIVHAIAPTLHPPEPTVCRLQRGEGEDFNAAIFHHRDWRRGAYDGRRALKRAKVEPGEVDEVILGQILTAAQGQNPARQAAIAAGIPVERPPGASTSCAARACARWRSAQAIRNGDADIVVAGGQEA